MERGENTKAREQPQPMHSALGGVGCVWENGRGKFLGKKKGGMPAWSVGGCSIASLPLSFPYIVCGAFGRSSRRIRVHNKRGNGSGSNSGDGRKEKKWPWMDSLVRILGALVL